VGTAEEIMGGDIELEEDDLEQMMGGGGEDELDQENSIDFRDHEISR
jgi:hypothetical protein